MKKNKSQNAKPPAKKKRAKKEEVLGRSRAMKPAAPLTTVPRDNTTVPRDNV